MNSTTNNSSEEIYFTQSQWSGLVITNYIVSSVSLASSICVLTVYVILLIYRPNIVNRLSLRFITLASILDSLYSACQLVIDHISSDSISCRAIAYILISTDTMACMCLAIVGLNLVMIFAIRVSTTLKLEIVYYLIVAASGVLVSIIPSLVGNKTGPVPNSPTMSCWEHYYFEGRLRNHFNWLWYYGWLLFSAVFATIVAAISIFFVVKAHGNYAGTLDMQTRRTDGNANSIYNLRKHGSTASVFRKITVRCICYPLVPLVSKIWGISIELAIVSDAQVPYTLFFLDRLFPGLQGFMVACIYFTDPAICMVFSEIKDAIKLKYVHDYYSVLFKPSSDYNSKYDYPKLIKITSTQTSQPQEKRHSALVNNIKTKVLEDIGSEVNINEFVPNARHGKVDPEKSDFAPPSIVLQIVRGQACTEGYTIVKVTSKNGKSYIPSSRFDNDKDTTCIIPLQKIRNTKLSTASSRTCSGSSFHDFEILECLAPFSHPRMAKFMHWVLISIFKVKPTTLSRRSESLDTEEKSVEVTREPLKVDGEESASSDPSSLKKISIGEHIKVGPSETYTEEGQSSIASTKKSNKGNSSDEAKPSIQRSASINVANLQRTRHYDEEGVLTLSNTEIIPESFFQLLASSSKRPTKANRPTPSSVWQRLAHPRSKSFTAHLDNFIELPTAVNTTPISMPQNSVFYDNSKYNTVLSSDQVFHEPSIQDPLPTFSNQLFPRPVSQYPKGKAKQQDLSPEQGCVINDPLTMGTGPLQQCMTESDLLWEGVDETLGAKQKKKV